MTTAAIDSSHTDSQGSYASMAKFGMIVFLLSEAMLFGGLIAAYIVLRVAHPSDWPPSDVINIQLASLNPARWTQMNWIMIVNSIILISSSFTFHMAESAIKHKGKLGILPLVATFVLGAIFLSVQGWEWAHLHHEGLWFNTGGIYGSSFFITTGFHGAHVFIGLLLILWVLLRQIFLRCYRPGKTVSLDNVGLYWHFVDIVWIVVYFSFYVI
ncbi:MAG: heme-copper oxidase subunit III [Chthoniobacterales bacterium]